MDKRTHIATVMDRKCYGNENYIFGFRNVVLGIYDEETKIFIDEYGNEYYNMTTEEALNESDATAVYNIMKIDDLKEKSKDKDLDAIIFDYQIEAEQKFYYVGFTDSYTPFIVLLSFNAMKKSANNVIKGKRIETDPSINVEKLDKLLLDSFDRDKYSKEDLEKILEKLYVLQDALETTIGTIETQVEAIDAGKTFRQCLDEKIEETNIIKLPEPRTDNKPDTSKLKEDLKRKHQAKLDSKELSVVVNPTVPKDKINIKEVFNEVTKYLISQDEPALRVITELARKDLHSKKKREGILLTGQSGSGKTYLMELIAKSIDRPFLVVDATQITVPGYVGKDIEQVLWDLYIKCGRNKEKAERAIIYFDEIDKKGSEKNDDVNAKGVLNVLLKFIEGTTYDAQADTKGSSQIVKIDTSNMTIILGGAFSDVYNSLIVNNTIGFDTEKNSINAPKYRTAETKDFVERGMMTNEFMGRVTVIKLNDLTLDDLKRILREGNESAIRIQETIFNKLGVKIKFTDGYIDSVAQKAYEKKTGARGLNGIVDESTWKVFEEVYENEGTYREAILTEETVEDNSKYKLVKVRRKK